MDRTQTRRRLAPFAIWPLTALAIRHRARRDDTADGSAPPRPHGAPWGRGGPEPAGGLWSPPPSLRAQRRADGRPSPVPGPRRRVRPVPGCGRGGVGAARSRRLSSARGLVRSQEQGVPGAAGQVLGSAVRLPDVALEVKGEATIGRLQAQARLPLHFERNVGQTDGQPSTWPAAPGTPCSWLRTRRCWRCAGAAGCRPRAPRGERGPDPEVVGEEPLLGRSHYFLGNDSAKWRTDVPQVRRVTYRGLWPGIDLTYYGDQRQLEYDFVVAPGADPGLSRLAFEGAEAWRLDARRQPDPRVEGGGEVTQKAPVAYQELEGKSSAVEVRYVIAEGRRRSASRRGLTTARARWSSTRSLVYSTYLGGSDEDTATASPWTAPATPTSPGEPSGLPDPGRAIQTFQRRGLRRLRDQARPGRLRPRLLHLPRRQRRRLGQGIAVDGAGNAYVTGTPLDRLPHRRPLQPTRRAARRLRGQARPGRLRPRLLHLPRRQRRAS